MEKPNCKIEVYYKGKKIFSKEGYLYYDSKFYEIGDGKRK